MEVAEPASGEPPNPDAMTAAHRTLPFGTRVTVTDATQRALGNITHQRPRAVCRGRVIDLTPAAARALGFSGLASVTIKR